MATSRNAPRRDNARAVPDTAEKKVSVVEEEAVVGKRVVETGRVRVNKTVSEREEVVDVPTVTEDVDVVRVPINRPVDAAPQVRTEGDTTIISVVAEEIVVQKRLVLREEIHLKRKRTESHNPQSVTLRSEDVKVERVGPKDSNPH